ncbi:GFA family protein [Novosphingobium acidiphilum]|uniref:GFA family protein n=1 Tax=Novosphingobium acidiphilum TaxID=505248 RepID=UPI00048B24C1|nr:GFA family protein [Novosphingobium acidiphilum]
MKAQCQCGQLCVDLPGPTPAVVACHCIACQRRTGSPFGVIAYYPADQVVVSGNATRFERATDTGNSFETFFCPTCGTTVYARTGRHPAMIGVTVGTIADPQFQPPVRSVWEQSMHTWVSIPGAIEHYPQGRV